MNKLTKSTALMTTLLIASMAACSTSPSTHLYVIEPTAVDTAARADTELTIALGPITLPAHLNRKEILTHDEFYRVSAAEFDRWAEPLDQNIAAALAENLSKLVPTDSVVTYPWDPAHKVDYTVRVRVHTFGTEPGGEVALSASWMVHDAANAQVGVGRKRYLEIRRGDDVVATVAAMSRAVEQLSRDIANVLSGAAAEATMSSATLAEGHHP